MQEKMSNTFLPPISCNFKEVSKDELEAQNPDRERVVCNAGMDVHMRTTMIDTTNPGESTTFTFNPRKNSGAVSASAQGKFLTLEEEKLLAAEDDCLKRAQKLDAKKPYYEALYKKFDARRSTSMVVMRDYVCKQPVEITNLNTLASSVLNEFPDDYTVFLSSFTDQLFGNAMRTYLKSTADKYLSILSDKEEINRLSWGLYHSVKRPCKQAAPVAGAPPGGPFTTPIADDVYPDNTLYWTDDMTKKLQNFTVGAQPYSEILSATDLIDLEPCIRHHVEVLQMLHDGCKGFATTELHARLMLEFANTQGRNLCDDLMLCENNEGPDYNRVTLKVPLNLFNERPTDSKDGAVQTPSLHGELYGNLEKTDKLEYTKEPMVDLPVGWWAGAIQSTGITFNQNTYSQYRWGWGHPANVLIQHANSLYPFFLSLRAPNNPGVLMREVDANKSQFFRGLMRKGDWAGSLMTDKDKRTRDTTLPGKKTLDSLLEESRSETLEGATYGAAFNMGPAPGPAGPPMPSTTVAQMREPNTKIVNDVPRKCIESSSLAQVKVFTFADTMLMGKQCIRFDGNNILVPPSYFVLPNAFQKKDTLLESHASFTNQILKAIAAAALPNLASNKYTDSSRQINQLDQKYGSTNPFSSFVQVHQSLSQDLPKHDDPEFVKLMDFLNGMPDYTQNIFLIPSLKTTSEQYMTRTVSMRGRAMYRLGNPDLLKSPRHLDCKLEKFDERDRLILKLSFVRRALQYSYGMNTAALVFEEIFTENEQVFLDILDLLSADFDGTVNNVALARDQTGIVPPLPNPYNSFLPGYWRLNVPAIGPVGSVWGPAAGGVEQPQAKFRHMARKLNEHIFRVPTDQSIPSHTGGAVSGPPPNNADLRRMQKKLFPNVPGVAAAGVAGGASILHFLEADFKSNAFQMDVDILRYMMNTVVKRMTVLFKQIDEMGSDDKSVKNFETQQLAGAPADRLFPELSARLNYKKGRCTIINAQATPGARDNQVGPLLISPLNVVRHFGSNPTLTYALLGASRALDKRTSESLKQRSMTPKWYGADTTNPNGVLEARRQMRTHFEMQSYSQDIRAGGRQATILNRAIPVIPGVAFPQTESYTDLECCVTKTEDLEYMKQRNPVTLTLDDLKAKLNGLQLYDDEEDDLEEILYRFGAVQMHYCSDLESYKHQLCGSNFSERASNVLKIIERLDEQNIAKEALKEMKDAFDNVSYHIFIEMLRDDDFCYCRKYKDDKASGIYKGVGEVNYRAADDDDEPVITPFTATALGQHPYDSTVAPGDIVTGPFVACQSLNNTNLAAAGGGVHVAAETGFKRMVDRWYNIPDGLNNGNLFSMFDAAGFAWANRVYDTPGDTNRPANPKTGHQDNMHYWSRIYTESFVAAREQYKASNNSMLWEEQIRDRPDRAFRSKVIGSMSERTWKEEFPLLSSNHPLREKIAKMRSLSVMWFQLKGYSNSRDGKELSGQPDREGAWLPLPVSYQVHLMKRKGLYDTKTQVPMNPWSMSDQSGLFNIFNQSYHSPFVVKPGSSHFQDWIDSAVPYKTPQLNTFRPFTQYGGTPVSADFVKHRVERCAYDCSLPDLHREMVHDRFGHTGPIKMGKMYQDSGLLQNMLSFEYSANVTTHEKKDKTKTAGHFRASNFLAYARVHAIMALGSANMGVDELSTTLAARNYFRFYVDSYRCAGTGKEDEGVPIVLGYRKKDNQLLKSGDAGVVFYAATLNCINARLAGFCSSAANANEKVCPMYRQLYLSDATQLFERYLRGLREEALYKKNYNIAKSKDASLTPLQFANHCRKIANEHINFLHHMVIGMMMQLGYTEAQLPFRLMEPRTFYASPTDTDDVDLTGQDFQHPAMQELLQEINYTEPTVDRTTLAYLMLVPPDARAIAMQHIARLPESKDLSFLKKNLEVKTEKMNKNMLNNWFKRLLMANDAAQELQTGRTITENFDIDDYKDPRGEAEKLMNESGLGIKMTNNKYVDGEATIAQRSYGLRAKGAVKARLTDEDKRAILKLDADISSKGGNKFETLANMKPAPPDRYRKLLIKQYMRESDM